jgi:multicomponent Na+:H+ antiporter subunit F
MAVFDQMVALFLLLTVLGGLLRVWLGPTAADRMLAAQLFGTSGTAIALLLAEALDRPALRDVALIYSLLAAVAISTFVKRYGRPFSEDQG